MAFFGLIPHLYYYVPPCPVCGSEITGRYIKKYMGDNGKKIIEDGFRHGEIIKLTPQKSQNNCFCLACNNEWSDIIQPMMIRDDRMEEEIKKRHINELFEYYMSEEEEQEKKKKGFFF